MAKSTFWKRFKGEKALFALVFLSGAAGLLYQVVWHKYLSILLGSQARATALVLAVFLGGLSAGYAAFGYWASTRRWNLIKVYAYIEIGLLAWALAFPLFFKAWFPVISSFYHLFGINSLATDIFTAVLLLGPPTFLMGGTLPLLTQALSPDFTKASYWHARIYGFNTVGAAIGSLFTGYFLVPEFGLITSLYIGAFLNAIVAGCFYYFYAPDFEAKAAPVKPKKTKAKTKRSKKQKPSFLPNLKEITPKQWSILGVGFLSGFYVLTLETVLIRLAGLSTGSSNYNFTLVVSIFVFALGLGSLLVQRIEKFKFSHLFWNQVAISIFLFALYHAGDHWPYWVHVMRAGLRDISQNFFVFQTRLALAFAFMLVIPVGLCGLTLPLCFHLIKESKEKLGISVGWLYGLNTVGAVAGALVGGYALFYFYNLDQIFKFTIFLSLLSVCIVYPHFATKRKKFSMQTTFAGFAFVAVLVGTWTAPLYKKENYIQPFRKPRPIEDVTFSGSKAFTDYLGRNTTYLHYEDGPNTSLGIGKSVYDGKEYSRTIFVNGKSDGNTRGDLFTTVMLGHIPGILSRRLEDTAVIGFGTGITIGILSLYPQVKNVDVMEISSAVVKNASYFDRYNGTVTEDKKIKIHQMDAFRFLSGSKKKYDLIVSEPSNPWVSGVENLYSSEFYTMAKKKLHDDGLFVQWIHTYSFTDELFRMVLHTMTDHFKSVSVFQLKGGDLALVGRDFTFEKADFQRAEARFSNYKPVNDTLMAYGIKRLETLLALEIIPPSLARSMGKKGEVHTLENPKLSHQASRAFFDSRSARAYEIRRKDEYYYKSIDEALLTKYLGRKGVTRKLAGEFRQSFCDHRVSKISHLCTESLAMEKILDYRFNLNASYSGILPNRDIAKISAFHQRPGARFGSKQLKDTYEMFDVLKKYYSPVVRIPLRTVTTRLDYCLRRTGPLNNIHGECLLQKILLLQMLGEATKEYKTTVNRYYAWFNKLTPSRKDYRKFQEAKQILDRLEVQ